MIYRNARFDTRYFVVKPPSSAMARSAALVFMVLASLLTGVRGHHDGLPQALMEAVREEYGQGAENRLRLWQELIHDNLHKTTAEKLRLVNDFFNSARFVDDQKLWGVPDYWATPVEFLSLHAGDCEDFSIAKYFTLRDMGVDTEKLRITYVKATEIDQAHMVLAYYPTPSSEPLILDNLISSIRPASERQDLVPVYSFNGENLWLSRTRNEQIRAGEPGQIGHWRGVLRRMEREHAGEPRPSPRGDQSSGR